MDKPIMRSLHMGTFFIVLALATHLPHLLVSEGIVLI